MRGARCRVCPAVAANQIPEAAIVEARRLGLPRRIVASVVQPRPRDGGRLGVRLRFARRLGYAGRAAGNESKGTQPFDQSPRRCVGAAYRNSQGRTSTRLAPLLPCNGGRVACNATEAPGGLEDVSGNPARARPRHRPAAWFDACWCRRDGGTMRNRKQLAFIAAWMVGLSSWGCGASPDGGDPGEVAGREVAAVTGPTLDRDGVARLGDDLLDRQSVLDRKLPRRVPERRGVPREQGVDPGEGDRPGPRPGRRHHGADQLGAGRRELLRILQRLRGPRDTATSLECPSAAATTRWSPPIRTWRSR